VNFKVKVKQYVVQTEGHTLVASV